MATRSSAAATNLRIHGNGGRRVVRRGKYWGRRPLILVSFRRRRFVVLIPLIGALGAIVILFSGVALADDLDKIDRTINGQPAYASKAPKYCLLVFGPKAQTRVWLVLDLAYDPLREKPGAKDMLYADLNGNGDLTDPEERIPVTVVTKKSSDGRI